MTSLAKQLESLAIPHTRSILTPDARQRVSLLFDPKEAANLDREAVYALGISGLEDLENIDPSFVEFEGTLFSESSQTWERSLQTREVNQQLDVTIENFLVKLSPYFLLKSAHKALEWLIFRYHIQDYNVDQLMMCILPYHETNIFVRAVQLLQIEKPTSRWHWLYPLQKPGAKLSRLTVVTHCVKDHGFLTFVCEMVQKFVKVHGKESQELRTVIAFYATTILGALQSAGDITEQLVSYLLPSLLGGLKSKCLDYKAASYMILAQLVVQVPLKDKLLTSLIPVLTKHISSKLVRETLSCLIIVYQNQNLTSMSKKSLKRLCKVPGMVHTLVQLAHGHQVSALLRVFLPQLVPRALRSDASASSSSGDEGGEEFTAGPAAYGAVLETLLSDLPLDPETAVFTCRLIIQSMVEQLVTSGGQLGSETVCEERGQDILRTLEKKYPVALDSAFESAMIDSQSEEEKQVLQQLTRLTVSAAKHQQVADGSTSLYLSINHASSNTRLAGVQCLRQCLKDAQALPGEFVKDAVLTRLQDDNKAVVLAILRIEKLDEKLSRVDLLGALFELLTKTSQKADWEDVNTTALEVLCNFSELPIPATMFLIRILPYMFSSAAVMSLIVQSPILRQAAECKLLVKKMKNVCKKKPDTDKAWAAMKAQVMRETAKVLAGLSKEQLQDKLVLLGPQHFPLALCISSCICEHETSMSGAMPWLMLTIKYLGNVDKVSATEHDPATASLEEVMNSSLYESCSSTLVRFAVGEVNKRLKEADILNSGWCDMKADDVTQNQTVQLCCHLLESLLHVLETAENKQIIKTLIHMFLMDTLGAHKAMQLITFILTSPHLDLTLKMKISSCSILEQIIQSHGCAPELQQQMVICVLVTLNKPDRILRHAALRLLNLMKGQMEKSSKMSVLFKKLLKCQEELLADPSHVLEALSAVFSLQSGSPGAKAIEREEKKKACLEQLLAIVGADNTPLYMRPALLRVLSRINPKMLLDKLVSLGEQFLKPPADGRSVDPHSLVALHLILELFVPEMTDMCTADSQVLQLLLKALAATDTVADLPSPQAVALKQVTREFFKVLPSVEAQRVLVSRLLEVYSACELSTVASTIMSTLKQLKLDGDHVTHELAEFCPKLPDKSVKGVKRVRTSKRASMHSQQELSGLSWKRLSVLLEVLQARKKIKHGEMLIQQLFSILSRILEDDKDTDEDAGSTEYMKQLLLTCLHNISVHLINQEVPIKQESFQVELLVQCIRSSTVPQTHSQVLQLMTTVAHIFPDYILHNVMSVFTFMGSGLLQQDDSYSLEVISRTIEAVIPALIQIKKKNKKSSDQVEEIIHGIMTVFVDARRHIAAHRSLALFDTLVNTVGVEHYLWVALVFLMENAVCTKDASQENTDLLETQKPMERDLEFMLTMVGNFSVEHQVMACSKVLGHLQVLAKVEPGLIGSPHKSSKSSHHKKDKGLSSQKPVLLHLETLSLHQFYLIQYHLTKLMGDLLAHRKFSQEVLSLDESRLREVVPRFQGLLTEALHYVRCVIKLQSAPGTPQSTNKFWKSMLHKVYDIFDKVNCLLPTQTFVQVTLSMIEDEVPVICRKSLELLNMRLQQILQRGAQTLAQDEMKSLLSSMDKLLPLIQRKGQDESEAEGATIKQLALYSIKLLCKLLGDGNSAIFVKVLPPVVDILTCDRSVGAVTASALLCLAELVSTLRALSIPHLARFMPPVLTTLKSTSSPARQELQLVCALTALQKIVMTLPHFLSPYMQDIVTVTAKTSAQLSFQESLEKSQAAIRVKAVRTNVATVLSPRVLLPALTQAYHDLLDTDWESISSLMDLLEAHINHISSDDLTNHLTPLQTLVLEALNFRSDRFKVVDKGNLEKVEGSVVNSILAMVVRLSEATFRPLFFKLFDWACRNEDDSLKLRRVTFYRLADSLADKLKGLFNLFVGYTLQNASTLLNDNNNAKTEETRYFSPEQGGESSSCDLLQHILGCLQKCFLYDSDGMVTKEVFDMLMQPLVDQLENFIGGEEAYEKRVLDHVTPCLTQFAVATNDDASWKTLNYQILLKTRHSSPKVRFAALKVTEALAQKLGDDYMGLLPETIPFLAELMEDENEEVERLCQDVMGSMEEVLGEPLQKYF